MPAEPALEELRAAILRVFPEHAGAEFRLLVQGFDSVAVDVDCRLIFKFPRHAEAEKRLKTEARVLDAIRPAVTMRVPALTLHAGPPLFSRHEKLQGEHLLAADYEKLPDEARARLAAEMARFYAGLHALDPRAMEAAGARPIETWLPADEILRLALPLLPPALHGYAERTIAAYKRLPPDPLGTIFGFFDGHGWNMAFDHAGRRLNGIYDFGDSGFGPLHMEFVQPGWISRDHVGRVVGEYERLTGRALDRGRIELLSAVLRLSELGGFAGDLGRLPAAIRTVEEWAAHERPPT